MTPDLKFQDRLIRRILALMGARRMSSAAMCQLAGINESHWSEIRNLKKTLSLEHLRAISVALDLTLMIEFDDH